MTTDFSTMYHGSIIVLTPQTDAAEAWVAENLPEDAQTWGRGTVIEARYFEPIYDGIIADGLAIN
jgi:hypothetical protein